MKVKTKSFGSGSDGLNRSGSAGEDEDKPEPIKLPRRGGQKDQETEEGAGQGKESGQLTPRDDSRQLPKASSGQAPKADENDAENAAAQDQTELTRPEAEADEEAQSDDRPSNNLSGTQTGRRGQDQDQGLSPEELREVEKNLPKRFIEPPISLITAIDDIMGIQNPDPEKIKYVVNFGTFVDKVPSVVVNHIIEIGYSNHVVPNQDTLTFMSFPVSSEDEAKDILNRAVGAGFGDPPPQLQGEYDGTQLTLEQTRTLHDRAKANREEDQ